MSNNRVKMDQYEVFLPRLQFQSVLDVLKQQEYDIIAPTIHQEAIVYDEISSIDQLPHGWTDEQTPGRYRLKRREDDALFGYVVGPHSWKKYLFPPVTSIGDAQRVELGWKFSNPTPKVKKLAFLGMRSCELAALAVQDGVFMHGPYSDTYYCTQRDQLFLIAVNCTLAASTCFCTSMQTGPRCNSGYDLAITELDDGFLMEVGSDTGMLVLRQLPTMPATAEQLEQGKKSRQQAIDQISKHMDTNGIRDLLLNNLEHPRWNEVANRCLSCANCTMVCPTCFCSTVEEVTNLTGDHVDRVRRWDSCFNSDFSYTSSGTVRSNTHDRYRQWMTHKLASWHDQFGMSGCVGCGRCITWCPVGIDITEEVKAIRQSLPMVNVPHPGAQA